MLSRHPPLHPRLTVVTPNYPQKLLTMLFWDFHAAAQRTWGQGGKQVSRGGMGGVDEAGSPQGSRAGVAPSLQAQM